MNKDIKSKILITMQTIHDCGESDHEEIVQALMSQGLSQLEAEVFHAFVPLAFGRVFIVEQVGITASDSVSIFHEDSGAYLSLQFKDEPVYLEAYKLAREMSLIGAASPEQLKSTISYSAEVHAISQAVNAGTKVEKLKGGTLHPSVLVHLSQAAGFEDRYPQLAQQLRKASSRPSP